MPCLENRKGRVGADITGAAGQENAHVFVHWSFKVAARRE